MPDDLFARFKTRPTRPEGGAKPTDVAPVPSADGPAKGKEDDDSGLAYRGQSAAALGEGEVLAAIEAIPAIPVVVQRLLARVGDQAINAGELETLIEQDMALAGRLLKLVNSPFYGLDQRVASIAQALQIVGFSTLRCLVLAASTSNLLALDLCSYGFAERGLWRNSVATAAVCRAIALRNGAGKEAGEEYFTAGLMRDVGMLVLGPFLEQRRIALRSGQEGEPDILRRERRALGFDHCWVGDRVAERWTLPPRLRLCIAHHHRIPAGSEADELRMLASVRLAERLTYAAGIGVRRDHPFDARLDPVLVQAAGLGSGPFQALVKEMPTIISLAEMQL